MVAVLYYLQRLTRLIDQFVGALGCDGEHEKGAWAEAVRQGVLKRIADQAIQKWFNKRCGPARSASQAALVKTTRLYQGRHRQDLALDQEASNQWWCHRKQAIVLLPLVLSLSVPLCGFHDCLMKLVFLCQDH